MGLFNLLKKAVDVSTEVATTAIYAVGEEQRLPVNIETSERER